MIIICPYSPSKRLEAQQETFKEQERLFKTLKDNEIMITRQPCEADEDYYNLLKKYWGKDDILIWEHDVVATYKNVMDLYFCQEQVCAFDYKRIDEVNSMHRIIINNDTNKRIPVTDNDKYADFVGFGFTKISIEAQKIIPIESLDRKHWQTLDTDFSYKMIEKNIKGHIHRPCLKHNHDLDKFK